MKIIELRDKADVELQERLSEIRKDLFDAQFRGGQDEVEERGVFRKLRREVARIETLLQERKLGIHGQAPVGGTMSAEEGG